MSDLFDPSPLLHTASLPMSAPAHKVYNYAYDNGEFVKVVDSDEILQKLNPFGGELIQLKPQYVSIKPCDKNLLTDLVRHDIQSYG